MTLTWCGSARAEEVVNLGTSLSRFRPLVGLAPTPAPSSKQAVLGLLNQAGPGVSVPTLRELFPAMARNELTELLHCYRQVWQTQHPRVRYALRWLRPGTVWAMDFAEPPGPIDGRFSYLLAVRDLASGRQLLWRPVKAESADVVIAELTPLFMSHGAPWV